MIWYCQKLYFTQISFFSFSPLPFPYPSPDPFILLNNIQACLREKITGLRGLRGGTNVWTDRQKSLCSKRLSPFWGHCLKKKRKFKENNIFGNHKFDLSKPVLTLFTLKLYCFFLFMGKKILYQILYLNGSWRKKVKGSL